MSRLSIWNTYTNINPHETGWSGEAYLKSGGYPMWYVVQVRTGTEENIRIQCEKLIDGRIMEKCFIPYYQEKKKYEGSWHTLERVLFPGYVFIITDFIEELYEALRDVMGMTKVIGTGKEIVPLTDEEVNHLLRLGKESQMVEMSIGRIENGILKVTEGPLLGMEEFVKKIDRHKRKCWLEMEMFGRTVTMQVGLEVVSKS